MPVVCEHILFFHNDLTVVSHCDDVMQVFEFNIVIVILTLIIHGIISFHKCCAVGFKLATKCFSILEHFQDILRDIHPFCVVTLTEKMTPHIIHAGMIIHFLLTGLYMDIYSGACGCSLQVRKGIAIINMKFIFSQ